jgi:hypothetical protein
VDDLRSRQVSEQNLELLLQVHAFAKSAAWYEQSSRAGQNAGDSISASGRVLLRSARRVEQGMETASQERAYMGANFFGNERSCTEGEIAAQ